jgi:hypothetical protein
MKRNPPPTPPPLLPKFKRNKSKAPWVHAWTFHWLHEIFIPKRVHHRLEAEWEMRKTRWGDRRGALCTGLTLVSLVLPKGSNMQVLQILAPPSFRLRLLESPKNYNTYIVNIRYKCRSTGECNSHIINCDYSLHTPTKQIFSSYFEMCWYCITFI